MEIEERVAMLESNYKRLSDRVELNNAMTSDMYSVFKEMQPGFKFLTDLYSLLARVGKVVWCVAVRFAKASKVAIPIAGAIYVAWSWFTTGKVPLL